MVTRNGHQHPFEPGARVAAYCRDSGGATQELSIEQQRAVIAAWCQEEELSLSHFYADARSGKSTAGRVQFDRMIADLRRGLPVAGLVLWDLSRWARNYDDGTYFVADLRRLGYAVYSLKDNIPEGSVGRVIESLKFWASQEYLEKLSRDIKRGQAMIAEVYHAYPKAVAPVGYKKIPFEIGLHRDGSPHMVSRLEPDPEAAPRVAQAFELRASGQTVNEIHAATRIYPHAHASSYRKLFRNRIYIGELLFGKLRIANFCPAIVSDSIFLQVNSRAAQHPRRERSTYLLSGLVVCELCGRAMSGNNAGRNRYYTCNNNSLIERCPGRSLRADDLDGRVLRAVRAWLSGDGPVELIDRALMAMKEPRAPDELDALAAEYRAIEQAAARIVAAIEAGGHNDYLVTRLRQLGEARAAKQAEIEEAQARRRTAAVDLIAAGERIQAARADLQADPRRQQLALRAVVVRVSHQAVTVALGGMEQTIDL